jgi:hypothetical protein
LLSDYKFDISFDWDYVPLQDYFSKTPSDGYSGAWTYMDRYISGIGYVWYFGDEASGYELLYPSDGYIRTEDVVEWEATYYLAMSEMVTITEDGETWEDYIDTSWPSNPGTTWYHYSYSGDFMSLFRGTVAFTAYFLGMADVYMEMRVDTERFISSGFLDNTVYGSVASSDSRGDYDEKSTYMFIYGAEKHNTSQDQIVYTEWATDSSGENSAYTNTPREDETWTEEFYIVVGSPIDGYYEFPLYDLGLLTADDYKLNLNPQVHCMRIYDYDGHPLYVYCYYTRHFQKYFYGYVYKGKHKQAEFLPTRVASQDYPRHDFFDSISEDSLYGYGQIRAALENGKYTEKRTYETD